MRGFRGCSHAASRANQEGRNSCCRSSPSPLLSSPCCCEDSAAGLPDSPASRTRPNGFELHRRAQTSKKISRYDIVLHASAYGAGTPCSRSTCSRSDRCQRGCRIEFLQSRVVSCRVVSCRVVSWLVLSCLVLSCLVLSCLVLSCLILSWLLWFNSPFFMGGRSHGIRLALTRTQT